MTKTFYIVRHGDKVKVAGDPPLSDLGNHQAKQTAQYLKSFPVSRIISSPLLRTQQTAQHIADSLGLHFETNALLKERVNWGDDPKQTFPDFLSMWNTSSLERNWQPPVGDSSIHSGQRLEKIIHDLMNEKDEHIVLVTHGGITTDFLRNVFTDDQLNHFIKEFDLTLDENIQECSVTIVEADGEKQTLTLKKLASTDHLIAESHLQ